MKYLQEVIITDYEGFDPSRCFNGGAYSFTVVYEKIKRNTWEVSYFTSADFDYCPKRGQFQQCWNCWNYDREEGECTEQYQTVHLKELKSAIATAIANKHCTVKINGTVIKESE